MDNCHDLGKYEVLIPELAEGSKILRKAYLESKNEGMSLENIANRINETLRGYIFTKDSLRRTLLAGLKGGLTSPRIFERNARNVALYYRIEFSDIKRAVNTERARNFVKASLMPEDTTGDYFLAGFIEKISYDDYMRLKHWYIRGGTFSFTPALANMTAVLAEEITLGRLKSQDMKKRILDILKE